MVSDMVWSIDSIVVAIFRKMIDQSIARAFKTCTCMSSRCAVLSVNANVASRILQKYSVVSLRDSSEDDTKSEGYSDPPSTWDMELCRAGGERFKYWPKLRSFTEFKIVNLASVVSSQLPLLYGSWRVQYK